MVHIVLYMTTTGIVHSGVVADRAGRPVILASMVGATTLLDVVSAI
jgi:hypothetical protein